MRWDGNVIHWGEKATWMHDTTPMGEGEGGDEWHQRVGSTETIHNRIKHGIGITPPTIGISNDTVL